MKLFILVSAISILLFVGKLTYDRVGANMIIKSDSQVIANKTSHISSQMGDIEEYEQKNSAISHSEKIIKDSIEHICFSDQNHGWFATQRKLFKTVDSGKTWQEIKINIPQDAFIKQILFNNATVGWLVLQKDVSDINEYNQKYAWLMKTSDGGQTWICMYESKAIEINQILFTDELNGWFIGTKYTGISPFTFTSIIANTNNQGADWTDVSEEFNSYLHEVANTTYINEPIVRLTQKNDSILTITSGKWIFATSNLGKSWKYLDSVINRAFDNTGLRKFSVKDDGSLWFLGSTNGDHGTWINLYTQQTNEDWKEHFLVAIIYSDIEYLSKEKFLLSGDISNGTTKESVLLYSKNAGQSWVKIFKNNKSIMNDIAINDDKAWIACDDGTIVKIDLSKLDEE